MKIFGSLRMYILDFTYVSIRKFENNDVFNQIHGKYDKLPMRVAARALSYIAPRFYIPSRALALDPCDVIADEKDRYSIIFFSGQHYLFFWARRC